MPAACTARFAAGLALLLLCAQDLRGQCETVVHAPPASSGETGFGAVLATSGGRILAGGAGRAVVLLEADEARVLLAPPPGTTSGDGFGAALALCGGTAAVGAPSDGGAGPGAGAVHLYEEQRGGWRFAGTLRPADVAREGREAFGTSLALQGGTLLVGRPGYDGNGDDRGAVDVFERAGAGWRQTGQLTEDGSTTLHFGTSVALDGDRALVGTPGLPEGPGGAFVFERDIEGYWGQTARLESESALVPGLDFGRAVLLAGDLAVVGAPGWKSPDGEARGALFVFGVVAELWTQLDVLHAPGSAEAESLRGLGAALALHGDVLAAGAPEGRRGAVLLFARGGVGGGEAAGPAFWPRARVLFAEGVSGAANVFGALDALPTRFGAALAWRWDARVGAVLVVGAPAASGGGALHEIWGACVADV